MEKEYIVRILEERDMEFILDIMDIFIKPAFIEKKSEVILNHHLKEIEIDKLNIRRKLYNYQDEYICVFSNEKLICFTSISVEYNTTQSAIINFLYCKNRNANYVKLILNEINEKSKEIFMKYINKLRITLPYDDNAAAAWIISFGFKKEVDRYEEGINDYVYFL